MIKAILKPLKSGILENNPIFSQLLGMCSTLAITTSVINGISMGIAVTLVLVFSNLLISLLRKIIPRTIRIASYIVIISCFVTVIELVMKAYLPALDRALGLFIPLIVVNCIVLARAESFASKNAVLPSVADGLGIGIGFTIALVMISAVREIIGNGTFLGFQLIKGYQPALLFVLPAGAFITLGCLMAAVNFVSEKIANKKRRADL